MIIVIGVGWYSEDEWTMLKLSADDPEALDSSYDQWRAGAEKTFQELRGRSGVRAVKIPVDVQEMRQWCREHGKKLDGEARAEFIAEKVGSNCVNEDEI